MTTFKCLAWSLTCTSLVYFCNCEDSIASVIERLDQFEEELLDNKDDMIRMEKRILNIINGAKTSLRAELKENIGDKVREAMAEILQGESLQDMVKTQVVSELRHLKQGYHQMKRQIHHVSKELKDFQDETSVFHETVLKKARVGNRENSSDVSVKYRHRLEIELQKCEVTTADLKADIKRCMTLNETCQFPKQKHKTTFTVHHASPATQNDTSTSGSPVLTSLMTTQRLPVSTTSVTTQGRQEERSRILIAPRWSSTQHQFRQLNIHSNSLSVYQYLTMKNVLSVAYVAKTRKLLIGLNNPRKIVSSALDTSHVTVLREGVQTYGMAVDEERDIVFMTTDFPRHSISRMSTQGKDFTTIVNLSNYGNWPSGITLDNKRKKIYGCNGGKLFMVTYDGQGLATLATGNGMYAVTLDQTAGVLYYNNDKKLMKMTVSNNVSTEVTTLTARSCNMRLYRGTIYYGGCGPPIVGAVDVTYNTLEYTLQSVGMEGVDHVHLCLIP
ncbi:uncharacterized protein [Haliotis cracherodii]|uniref:uncharacterized protein n=1 Tax=Haliotis cracherodii TaxID=6455 RepID=UPI0039E992B6